MEYVDDNLLNDIMAVSTYGDIESLKELMYECTEKLPNTSNQHENKESKKRRTKNFRKNAIIVRI